MIEAITEKSASRSESLWFEVGNRALASRGKCVSWGTAARTRDLGARIYNGKNTVHRTVHKKKLCTTGIWPDSADV